MKCVFLSLHLQYLFLLTCFRMGAFLKIIDKCFSPNKNNNTLIPAASDLIFDQITYNKIFYIFSLNNSHKQLIANNLYYGNIKVKFKIFF